MQELGGESKEEGRAKGFMFYYIPLFIESISPTIGSWVGIKNNFHVIYIYNLFF
jgi:hypothetical protein